MLLPERGKPYHGCHTGVKDDASANPTVDTAGAAVSWAEVCISEVSEEAGVDTGKAASFASMSLDAVCAVASACASAAIADAGVVKALFATGADVSGCVFSTIWGWTIGVSALTSVFSFSSSCTHNLILG